MSIQAPAAIRVPATRWVVLGGYALLAACTQLLWLTFAAIDTQSAKVMHVDVGSIGDLAAVFPFAYIVLALPTGRWLDSAFRQALTAGAGLTAAGALVRLVSPTSYGWQLAGQLVIAAGQPLVLNSITKVAARHFPPAERATAISVGTAALFVGILAAVLMAGPVLDAGGLNLLLWLQAVVALVAAAYTIVAFAVVGPAFPDDPTVAVSLRWLLRDRFMWTLAVLLFIGMGTYNAVATWLQPILDHFGEGDSAGNLIAVLTFAGVVGAAVLPTAIARRDRRRSMLIVALAISAAAFTGVALIHNLIWLGAWLFGVGFVLLAALPVVLDWSDVHAGPERQGGAVGFLMMAGNLGGLVLVLVIQVVIGQAYLALGALAVISLLGIPVAARLPARASAT